MSTKPDQSESQQRTAAPRPLFAECRVTLRAADLPAGAAKSTGGRWRLNDGGEMIMCIWGLNMRAGSWGPEPQPVRVVVDLAQAQFDKPTIRCLVDHWQWMGSIAGWWKDPVSAPAGLDASLTWFEPDEKVRDAASEAVLARALVAAGDPMEASIGAYPRDGISGYELVKAGASVDVNGRTFAGAGDLPLYVLRFAMIAEASLVLWGASRATGQIAASRTNPPPKEQTVDLKDRIAALTAKHKDADKVILAGIQAGKTDEQIDADVAKAATDARLAALEADNAKLRTELEAAKKPTEQPAPTGATGKVVAGKAAAEAATPPAVRASGKPGEQPAAEEGDAPETLHAAMKQLTESGSKLTGFDLRAAALRKWPELRSTVPDAQVGKVV